MALQVLTSYDLNSKDMVKKIAGKIAGREHLHLCADKSVKDARSTLLVNTVPYVKGESDFTLATYLELQDCLRQGFLRHEKTIRVSDERFILLKIIEHMFKNNPERLRLFTLERFTIYEIFDFLTFHEVEVSEEAIAKIGFAYEQDVFKLYRVFTEIMQAIKSNKVLARHKKILGTDVAIGLKGLNTINNLIKTAVKEYLQFVEVLVLDGFYMFDDFTKLVIAEALKLKRKVYFTAKDKGGAGSFLFDSVYPKLFAELGQELTIPTPAKLPTEGKTALDYARRYYDGSVKNQEGIVPVSMLEDGSVRFIGPFRNRHSESSYIVQKISRLLKENCDGDVEKMKEMLANDIAVVFVQSGTEARFDRRALSG